MIVRPRSNLLLDLGLSVVLSLIVLGPLLIYGTPDEETYTNGMYPAEMYWKQLFSGTDPNWMGDYGTGVMGPSGRSWLALHPAALVLPWLGPAAAYRLIWLIGGGMAAFFCMRLLRWWQVDSLTRATAAFTVLGAEPMIAYSYVNDWPEAFLPWTTSFALLWSLLWTFRARDVRELRTATLVTALIAGMLVAVSQPVSSFALAAVLALVVVVLLAHRPAVMPRYFAAAAIAAVIALPNLAHTARLFLDPEAYWMQAGAERLSMGSIVYLAVRPFSESLLPAVMAYRGSPYRGLFFGGIFLCAAIAAAIAAVARWRRFDTDDDRRAATRALAVGFLAALVLVDAPPELGLRNVRMWFYRDPLILLGIPLAAIALSRIRFAAIRVPILCVHIAQMAFLLALPLRSPGSPNAMTVFNFDPGGSYGALLRSAKIPPHARISLAGSLATLTRRRLADTGVVSRVDLHRMGYAVTNDLWWLGNAAPSLTGSNVMASQGLAWSPTTLNSPAVRDLFGIQYVVGFEDEAGSTFDISGLSRVTSAPLGRDGRVAVVYRNATSWPRAAVLSDNVLSDYSRLNVQAPCSLQCDTLDWNAYRRQTPLVVDVQPDSLSIRFEGNPPPGSLLLITQTYHPEWRATVDGRDVTPMRFLGAFGYLPLTGTERSVVVKFGSPRWNVLAFISFAALAAVVVGILLQGRRTSR